MKSFTNGQEVRERKSSTTMKPNQLVSSSHTPRMSLHELHPVRAENSNLWFFRMKNDQCLNCGKEKHVTHADQCSESVAISATETDKAKGFVEIPKCATCGRRHRGNCHYSTGQSPWNIKANFNGTTTVSNGQGPKPPVLSRLSKSNEVSDINIVNTITPEY